MTSKLVVLLLAFSFTVAAYAMNMGITCTNDGSHFALTKSLFESSTAALGSNAVFAGHDSASYKGKTFADRNPGTAFLAVFWLKLFTPFKMLFSPIKLDPIYAGFLNGFNIETAIVMLLPAFCGGLLVYGFYLILEFYSNAPIRNAVVATLICASTLVLRYSTVLYSHILATTLITYSLYLVLRIKYRHASPMMQTKTLCLSGLLFGLACLVEHPVAVLGLPWFIASSLLAKGRMSAKQMALMMASAAIPILPLLIYNKINFDGFFSIAHFHHATFAYNHSISTIFNLTQAPFRLDQLLFFKPNLFISIFGSSPLLSFLVGLAIFCLPFSRSPFQIWTHLSTVVLCLVGWTLTLLPAALFSGDSGYDQDYRQALFNLPLLLPIIGLGLAWTTAQSRSHYSQRTGFLIVSVAITSFFSISTQAHHIRHQFQTPMPSYFMNTEVAVRNVSTAIALCIAFATVVVQILRIFKLLYSTYPLQRNKIA